MTGENFLAQALRCPICGNCLEPVESGLRCSLGHSFDRAKEGYFNLLPVHKKNSKEPGDSREQLRARQHFLEQGHYRVLVDALLPLIDKGCRSLIDLGAGEGYFTRQIDRHLAADSWLLGVDVAKEGVRLAAQAGRREQLRAQYVVASNFDVPCAAQTAECIVRIFAPSRDAELSRLLAPNGRLIIVAPAADHLQGLRQRIYRQVQPHEPPAIPQGFELQTQVSARGQIQLTAPADIAALLAMTPFSWRLRDSDKAALMAAPFSDQIAFDLFVYAKSSTAE